MTGPTDFTIADVARKAGVSVSTVSRILNDKRDVAEATRARVQRVIDELGYFPHAQAQGLRAGRSRNLALLFPIKYPGDPLYNSLELDFVLGAAAAANERAYLFNLMPVPVAPDNLWMLIRSAQVDGLVLMQVHLDDWRVDLLRESGFPFVMIGRSADDAGLSFIDVDFYSFIRAAFDHIVSLGHRDIGFIALPHDLREQGFGPAVRGWEGYQQALETHGLAPLYREVGYAPAEMTQAALDLLDERPSLSAFVTAHEFGSLNIGRALSERGRAVPEDCSLVSITTERIADLNTPVVTHVEFPAYMMGYRAIDLLIRRLEGDQAEPEQILVPPRLVIRNSTASLHERPQERSALLS